jgi:hypothetical protein
MELFGPFIFGVFLGGGATWFYLQAAEEMAQDDADIDPAGAGGPGAVPKGAGGPGAVQK